MPSPGPLDRVEGRRVPLGGRVLRAVALAVVAVPAVTSLVTQATRVHHALLEGAGPPAQLAEPATSVNDLATARPHVDSHEIHQLERAHAKAAADTADAVDLLDGGHPLGGVGAGPRPRTGARQRLTRKPGPSAARITRLPIASPASVATSSARSPVWSAAITSTSRIALRQVEEVHAHHKLGARGGAGQRGHRDGGGVGGEHRLRRDHRQLLEQLALELAALRRGLDDQLAAHEVLQPRRRGRVTQTALQRLGVGVVQQRLHPRRDADWAMPAPIVPAPATPSLT